MMGKQLEGEGIEESIKHDAIAAHSLEDDKDMIHTTGLPQSSSGDQTAFGADQSRDDIEYSDEDIEDTKSQVDESLYEELGYESPSEEQNSGTIDEKGEYQYAPLNQKTGKQVRLLVLHPGPRGERIYCSIIHTDLERTSFFEAVSYTWANEKGDVTLCKKIFLRSHGGFIRVTANCEAALQRIRQTAINRTIWIDSICINQSNIIERNHQVDLMASIYASAGSVLIYLGEEDLESRFLFGQESTTPLGLETITLPEHYRYDACNSFLSRKWFHRTWVIQEIALARHAIVICGEMTQEWNSFAQSIHKQIGIENQAILKLKALPIHNPSILSISVGPFASKNTCFLDILVAGRYSLCQDPRDKVFAFLSLTSDPLGIRPNYSDSVQLIYATVAVNIIQKYQDLRLLSHCKDQSLAHLPSWAPDWSVPPYHTPLPPQYPIHISGLKWPVFSSIGLGVIQNTPSNSVGALLRLRACKLDVIRSNFWLHSNRATDEIYIDSVPRTIDQLPKMLKAQDDFARWKWFFVRICPPCCLSSLLYCIILSFSLAKIRRPFTQATWSIWLPVSILAISLWLLFLCMHWWGVCLFRIRHQRHCECRSLTEFWSQVLNNAGPFTPEVYEKSIKIDIPFEFQSSTQCYAFHFDPTKIHEFKYFGTTKLIRLWWSSPHHLCRRLGKTHQLPNVKETDRFTSFATKHINGRQLFLTSRSLGIGPGSVQPEDSVWYLEGAQTPFVLRKDGLSYILVGPCYLHNALGLEDLDFLRTRLQSAGEIIVIK